MTERQNMSSEGNVMEILKDYWAIIMALGGSLIWLVRLESRTFANERELVRQREQRHEDMRATADARKETNERLEEIQRDIKSLISRGTGK